MKHNQKIYDEKYSVIEQSRQVFRGRTSEFFKKTRESSGYSIKELSYLTGIDEKAIRRIESGSRPFADTAICLILAMGTEEEFLEFIRKCATDTLYDGNNM